MMWLIIGVVIGVGLAYLVSANRSGRMHIRWYQWGLGVISVAFLLLAIQNYFALLDELQPRMANFALIAFGAPGLVSAILAIASPRLFRSRASSGATASKVKTA